MKTKTKILTMVEIAIVLCSVFLVAIPAIAAEQNTQKASANMITAASEDDFVLGVYGNANEDDTIDMRDLTYVKLIFFGKKTETELSDAKYDGKINPLDFIQIKLIIVGKEKELTVVDSADRIVTVKKPVERIIALGNYRTEAVKILGAVDKVVGISTYTKKNSPHYYPELLELPEVGSWSSPDYEQIIALEPDIVITSAHPGRCAECEEKLTPAGIVVLGFDFYRSNLLKPEIEKLGYIIGAREKAEEYIEWQEQYESIIKDYVDELSEEEKPKVYMEWWEPGKTYGKGSSGDAACTFAGGRNIASELPEYPTVDMEWVLAQNPDVILKYIGLYARWGWDDTEEPKDLISDVIESRPGWDTITAVKDNRFYVFSSEITRGPDSIAGLSHFAKWLHPALDIDPEGIYREYLEQFLAIEYPEDKIFTYPPLVS